MHEDLKDIHDEKADLAQREREIIRDALRCLQHHPWRHCTRLFFAALGFKIPPERTEDQAWTRSDIDQVMEDKPATA